MLQNNEDDKEDDASPLFAHSKPEDKLILRTLWEKGKCSIRQSFSDFYYMISISFLFFSDRSIRKGKNDYGPGGFKFSLDVAATPNYDAKVFEGYLFDKFAVGSDDWRLNCKDYFQTKDGVEYLYIASFATHDKLFSKRCGKFLY